MVDPSLGHMRTKLGRSSLRHCHGIAQIGYRRSNYHGVSNQAPTLPSSRDGAKVCVAQLSRHTRFSNSLSANLPGPDICHQVRQFGRIGWLHEIVVKPRGDGRFAIMLVPIARHRDKRRAGRARHRAQPARQLVPIYSR